MTPEHGSKSEENCNLRSAKAGHSSNICLSSPNASESKPEEDSGFDFSETEDEEEAAAEDDELSQAAVHGQSATIDLDEDDGLGEALEVF